MYSINTLDWDEQASDHIALVVVLAVGEDHKELENRELGPIDETVQYDLLE